MNDLCISRRVVHVRSSGVGAAPQDGWTALCTAALNGDGVVVGTLLAAGAAKDTQIKVRGSSGVMLGASVEGGR